MQCPLNLVLSSLLETLGCRPPYYIGHDNSLPKCLNPQNLKTAFSRTTIQNDTNPCRMIEKVIYTYEKMDGISIADKLIEGSRDNMFQLLFEFQGDTNMNSYNYYAVSVSFQSI